MLLLYLFRVAAIRMPVVLMEIVLTSPSYCNSVNQTRFWSCLFLIGMMASFLAFYPKTTFFLEVDKLEELSE